MRDIEIRDGLCNRLMLVHRASGKLKQDFAESIGITPQKLTNISRRRNAPPHLVIAMVAEKYGVTTDFLYFGTLGGMRDQVIADRLNRLMTPPAPKKRKPPAALVSVDHGQQVRNKRPQKGKSGSR